MESVVIVEACRTPVGSMGGVLRPLSAYDLAVDVMRGALDRSGIDPKIIDEVVMGQCRQTSDDPNLARLAALEAGIPESASGFTVMRQCASGMTAVHCGTMSIMTGVNDCVLAGGAESMSNGVFYLRNARYGVGTGNTELVDAVTEGQFRSQPQEIYGRYNMGATAQNIADQLGITREEQDAFSLTSQQRAIAAIDAGRFKDEIIPISVPQGKKKPPIIFDTDEFPRRDTSAEKLAKLKPCFNVTRDESGRLFNSSELTGSVTAASSSGRFAEEIVPVTVPQGKKKPALVVDTDEPPRFGMTMEKLARLSPCFRIRTDEQGRVYNDPTSERGTVTPGNSCGRNDGASAVLLMRESLARELGLRPLARVIGMGSGGCDPRTMGLGPVQAVPKALKNAGLTMDDIGLIELNEAFAAQSLGCIKLLGWEDKLDIINVNGGAIALGHPVGSSGCRIIVSLVHEMKRRGVKYGLATLCIAGGMGQATVVELCD